VGRIKNLRLPDSVLEDPDAEEILRVWITGDAQRFALNPDAWEDLRAGGFFWSIWLDMRRKPTKHGTNPEVALARIKEGFDVEWSNPTGP